MQYLEKHRRMFLLTGIGVCVIAIILTISPGIGSNIVSGGFSYVITPVQRGLNGAVSWVQGHFSALTNNQRLITINRELQAEINELQLANSRLAFAAEENAKLNAALNMQQRYAHLPTMGARVIAQDPNDFYSSFRIDRGSNDGIEPGMVIIANGGLAGVVRYVNPTSSQFVSVLDRRFAAAVVSVRTEDTGTARGDARLMHHNQMRIDHIEAPAQIMPGDEIKTSLDSAVFPAGLLLGEVVSIHTNPDGLTRHAILRPAADISDLEMVLVVTQMPGD